MISWNAFFDNTESVDSFGMARLVIDSTEAARTKFGARSSGADTKAMFSVNLFGSASGTGTTRIRLFVWNSHWTSATGTSNPFWLRNNNVILTGTRR